MKYWIFDGLSTSLVIEWYNANGGSFTATSTEAQDTVQLPLLDTKVLPVLQVESFVYGLIG